MILATYGSANNSKRSNWESAAWCLKAYSNYADGVLPWQSLGGPAALTRGDKPGMGNALIIKGEGKRKVDLRNEPLPGVEDDEDEAANEKTNEEVKDDV